MSALAVEDERHRDKRASADRVVGTE
jgi:hypothetical protein